MNHPLSAKTANTIPETAWGGAGGLAGGMGGAAYPHPSFLPPQPCLFPTLFAPGFVYAQANNHPEEPHSTGAGRGQEIPGHPSIVQIWGSEPKLEPDLLQVIHSQEETVSLNRVPNVFFYALIQQPL